MILTALSEEADTVYILGSLHNLRVFFFLAKSDSNGTLVVGLT